MPKLSICIPTFNRITDLEKCIRSVVAQVDDSLQNDVEIVISDNASTDGTLEMVQEYTSKYSYIRYYRNSENLGYARNINNAVSQSKGIYCWLLGSDDELIGEALEKVFDAIDFGGAIILGNPVTNGRQRHYLNIKPGHKFLINDEVAAINYLQHCTEISAAFAFISTLIVRRTYWDKVCLTEFELEHPYTHMLRLCKAVKAGGTIFYMGFPIVSTGFTENEWNKTILPYLTLDIETIVYIVDQLFGGNHRLRLAYGQMFKKQYRWHQIIKARVECGSQAWQLLSSKLAQFGYSQIILKKTPADKLLFAFYLWMKNTRKIFR